MNDEVLALGGQEDDGQEERMASESFARYKFYLRQRPVMLAVISVLVILFFLFVALLSRVHYAQRQALGNRWYTRGVADLKAANYEAAVTDFRAALLYSRDDYSYQLNLAEALIGQHRTGQASAYLLNLWEREPENGVVNLELARIANEQNRVQDAVRYYHDAIYAVWPADQESKRTDARLELVELLLRNHEPAQAQAELIALSENAGDDPAGQLRLGNLFLRAADYEHALASFGIELKTHRHDAVALAGSGYAAFQLGRYPLAEHYLQSALALNPNDTQSANLLKTTQMVLRMDPFRPGIGSTDRDQIVLKAFDTAGDRLKVCPLPKPNTAGPAGSLLSPGEEWANLKRHMSEAELRRHPDIADQAMDLVFRIERQTSIVCGTPTGADEALLRIAALHEGSQ
ncbi:MAG TPA: tetratricopeptide repeat protein [Candidatus Sulfotelmatobacter sp.]|nr:tetratricopeptide repeat protein [Candidatus Sulfotelmatobacter sp.]